MDKQKTLEILRKHHMRPRVEITKETKNAKHFSSESNPELELTNSIRYASIEFTIQDIPKSSSGNNEESYTTDKSSTLLAAETELSPRKLKDSVEENDSEGL